MRLKNNFRLQDFAFSLTVDIEEKTNLERFDIGRYKGKEGGRK